MGGDAADVVFNAKAGLICPPSNPRAMAETIRRFWAMSAADRDSMGKNGREAVCLSYGREQLNNRFQAMLAGVMASRRVT
jgi:glycosyltransferase involved in cell wall biosynthesis